MIRTFFKYIVIFFSSVSTYAQNFDVEYTVTHVQSQKEPYLKVNVKLKNIPSTSNTFLYPNRLRGQDHLFNCINNIKVLNDDRAKFKVIPEQGLIQLKNSNTKDIEIEYFVKQDIFKGINLQNRFRPIVHPNYFHVLAQNLFILPDFLTEKDKIDVKITWESQNETYAILNSFGVHQKHQEIKNCSLENFQKALFVGGDYRIISDKKSVALAIRDHWKTFDDKSIFSIVTNTNKAQKEFWKEQEEQEQAYAVVLSPIEGSIKRAYAGTSYFNVFTALMTNTDFVNEDDLMYLVNHELLHKWIGQKIKNQNEEEQYWFSEGFTEYYTYKIIAKNKINGKGNDYFLKKINEAIKKLWTSKLREIPNKDITNHTFWKVRGYRDIPYFRGAIFAFMLDLKISEDTNQKYNLDDVMRNMLSNAINKNQKLKHSYFIQQVNTYLKEDITSLFESYIVEGNLINLEELFTNNQLAFKPKMQDFDIGFTYKNQKITEISTISKAYQAGIRVNDSIIDANLFRDTTKVSQLSIIRNNEEMTIDFYTGSKEINIPQLEINKTNMDRLQTCIFR
ncbi:hypothetical protein NBT05_06220 [Aquimarina sp. ERC-38]|uniref:M1 family aminopeptidase n=1 Tax=Aquimarina sp. ERC-38 TaxID=2949996 RepID=UPI002246ED16|nr:M1 family aminopeptidase [Aquimarina sp. ERC-38]UZO82063.1 hypothetical protein NBT05_06220 [Aquimarina sp. ERC-38]